MAKGDQIKGFLGNFIKQIFKNEPSEYSKEIFEKVTNTKYIKPLKQLNKEQESGFFGNAIGFLTGYKDQLGTNPEAVSGRINGKLNEEIVELRSNLSGVRKDINDLKSREGNIKKYQTELDSLTQQVTYLEAKFKDAQEQANNNVKPTNTKTRTNKHKKNKTAKVNENEPVNNTTNKQPNYTNIINNLKNKIEKNNKEIEKNINLNNEFKQNVNELLKSKLFKKGSQISNEATSEDIQKIVDEAQNFIDLFKPENRQGKVKAWFEWVIQSDYEQSKTSERAQVQAGRISKTVAKAVVTQSIPQIMNGTQSFLSGKDEEQEYPQFGVMGQPMSYRDKLIRMVGNATQGV